MPPRVLLDATAVPPNRGGVGRYVDGLVSALAPDEVALSIACQASDEQVFTTLAPSARVVPGPLSLTRRPARMAWEQTGLPGLARKLGVDVIHSPHYTMPLRPGRPVVVTLHDATFFTNPELHTSGKAGFFRNATRYSVRRAARCITPSKATRDELIRILRVDGATIDVAPHGVDRSVFAPPTPEAVAAFRVRLGLGDSRFVAFLGTLEPRKNVPSLIDAFREVATELDEQLTLVIAGGQGWDESINEAVAKAREEVTVITPGYLPIEELPALMGGAAVLAYPALGEGFGLPVLEAMACGAVVLTTRLLSLPEVGGDAVAYTSPEPRRIAEALHELLNDDDLAERLRAAGLARAERFTWEASARHHVESYRKAASA